MGSPTTAARITAVFEVDVHRGAHPPGGPRRLLVWRDLPRALRTAEDNVVRWA